MKNISNYNHNQALSHSDTWIKRRYNVLPYTISLSNSLIFRSYLIVSLIVLLGLPLPLVNWLPSLLQNPQVFSLHAQTI